MTPTILLLCAGVLTLGYLLAEHGGEHRDTVLVVTVVGLLLGAVAVGAMP